MQIYKCKLNKKKHLQCKKKKLIFELFSDTLEEKHNLKNEGKPIPGPMSFPIFGSSWLYKWFGPYSHVEYHKSNFDKFLKYGPVVREEVLWNYPLFHLFDPTDIEKVLKYKSDTPYRPPNEADVFYR